jgi:drug/metabolite transporter (DMT)-like permease
MNGISSGDTIPNQKANSGHVPEIPDRVPIEFKSVIISVTVYKDMGMKKVFESRVFNYFIGIFVLVIWGFAYIVIRVTVKDGTIPPASLNFLRFAVGYVVLMLIPLRNLEKPGPRESRKIFHMGLTGIVAYFYFENTGLVHTSATNASILISLAPVLTVIGAAIFFKRKFTWLNALGFLLAFVGGALIVWNGKVNFNLKPIGDFLILLSAAAWAAYTLIGKEISERFSPILITRRITFIGIVFYLPLFIYELSTGKLSGVTVVSLGGVLYLGILCHALAITLWMRCMRMLGIVAVSNLIYLQCIVTMLLARLTISEPITSFLLMCTVAVVAGVYLSNLKRTGAYAAMAGSSGGV